MTLQLLRPLLLPEVSSVLWNAAAFPTASITLEGNWTLNASPIYAGATYVLFVVQDAVGSRTLTWSSVFLWIGAASPPTLSTTPGATDIMSFTSDGVHLLGVPQIGFA